MTALGWQLYDRTHFKDGRAKYVIIFKRKQQIRKKKY